MACLNSSEAEQTFKNKNIKGILKHCTVKTSADLMWKPRCVVETEGIPSSTPEVHWKNMTTVSIILCFLVVFAPPVMGSQDLEVSITINKPAIRNASDAESWAHFSPGNKFIRAVNY